MNIGVNNFLLNNKSPGFQVQTHNNFFPSQQNGAQSSQGVQNMNVNMNVNVNLNVNVNSGQASSTKNKHGSLTGFNSKPKSAATLQSVAP